MLIAFAAFIFVGLNALWQKESLEIRNRPYIEINRSSVELELNGTREWNGKLQSKLVLHMKLINHGAVPATVRKVIVKIHPNIQMLKLKDSIDFESESGLYQDWEDFDIFPSSDVEKQRSFVLWQYLGVEILNRILVTPLDEPKCCEEQDIKLFEEQVNQLEKLKPTKDLFVLIQVNYGAPRRDYSYWAIYKTNNKEIKTIKRGVGNLFRKSLGRVAEALPAVPGYLIHDYTN